MDDVFWNNTNSCFRDRKWTKPTSGMLECYKNLNCFKKTRDIHSLFHTDILMHDARLYPTALENPENRYILRRIGVMGPTETWMSFRRHILRLVINPSAELTKVILAKRMEMGPESLQVGMHVRCGGKLADQHESVEIVQRYMIGNFLSLAKSTLRTPQFRDGGYVFLSTDSTSMEKTLKSSMRHLKVHTFDDYTRGHTRTTLATDQTMKRAIVDLLLLSQSKTLIITSASGFSRAAKTMSYASVRAVRSSYHRMKCPVWNKHYAKGFIEHS